MTGIRERLGVMGLLAVPFTHIMVLSRVGNIAYDEIPIKENLMNKLHQAKNFVSQHPTSVSTTVGLLVGVTATFLYYNQKTLLEITPEQVNQMFETGRGVVYETPFGDLLLKTIPKN